MGKLYPSREKIAQLTVAPTEGELCLINYLEEHLDDSFLIFYEPFLNGSRPDLIILKENCGAVIIEIKDWDLFHYVVDEKNQWYVVSNGGKSRIKSPMSQVFTYKDQLFNMHLPILGLADIAEPKKNFFGVVHCFCYFHNALKKDLTNFYKFALDSIKDQFQSLNMAFKDQQISYEDYTKRSLYLERRRKVLSRDLNLSFGSDGLRNLLLKIEDKLQDNPIFSSQIYDDFYRRLSPPDFILRQNIPLYLDAKQKRIIESEVGFSKVKGVAGSGKTTLIAHRAISSYLRVEAEGNPTPRILILTYNITLRNYISDKLTEAQNRDVSSKFVLLNYHLFYLQQANEWGFDTNENIAEILNNSNLSVPVKNTLTEKIFRQNIFQGVLEETDKYHAIFIDEIQDFEPDWIKIIRDSFLAENGEMVLFGDQSQNIYQRDEINKRNSSIVQGFGRWITLKKSYRFSSDFPLINLFQHFQKQFLMEDYDENILINEDEPEMQSRLNLNQNIIEFMTYPEAVETPLSYMASKIWHDIKSKIKAYNYHPNDIVIIASHFDILKEIEVLIRKEEGTAIIFESLDEDLVLLEHYSDNNEQEETLQEKRTGLTKQQYSNYYRDIQANRRRKKNFFYQNSGKIKLASIHSYKGFESKVVFYVALPDDNAELIYTALTRCREDLYIYDLANNKYTNFLKQMTHDL
ncbi:NERD domain-containing protein [Ignatzschineria sp. LJL83]